MTSSGHRAGELFGGDNTEFEEDTGMYLNRKTGGTCWEVEEERRRGGWNLSGSQVAPAADSSTKE